MASGVVNEPLDRESPMRRLWRRYLLARGSQIGLTMIVVFMLIAFLAPFIAHRLPLVWRDGATGVTTYPLIREFFAPSDTTEPLLEKGLNFLFIFIPASLIVWKLMNKFLPGLKRIESRAVSLLIGALLSIVLWQALGGMLMAGAGNNWLYGETRTIPDSDDIQNINVLLTAPASQSKGQEAARNLITPLLASDPNMTELLADPSHKWTDADKEIVRWNFANIIDGQPLGDVEAFSGDYGLDSRGITNNNVSFGLNGQRWNRLLVELAYPGLFKPFIEFRSAFVLLICCTVLVLLGMTYIFMTGANQFALSPRILVLLILAALLSLLFGGQSRIDQTPYREMAASGQGSGIFPLIPYGPNEQGFGPRLPPDWASPKAEFSSSDILSWPGMARELNNPESNLYRLCKQQGVETLSFSPAPDQTEQAALLAELNGLITSGVIYSPEMFPNAMRDSNITPYLRRMNLTEEGLAELDRRRLNRLLLDRALPGLVNPVPATRWKKPHHQEGRHWIGTDESGRDVLTRLVHGSRVSLSVGFVSITLATLIGLVMGSLAAYYGGWVDIVTSRFMELMMCFPSFFLILAVIAVLDRRSILNIMLIIGLTSWTGIARLIRGEMLKHKRMDYVSASIALGASDARTIFRHILPNAMAPVLVSISFGITGAILTEASLSFIGFGVTPPTPTWGQLLSETRESPLANWWLAIFPGVILFLSVLSYNLVGEALRDALDPRSGLKSKS